MQAAILPITAGWFWIAQGYRLFLRQPLALLLWGMTTAALITASYLIPLLGQIALIAATPTLSFITLNACRHIASGQTMRLGMWLAPLRPVRGRLMTLGLTYLVCCLAGGFVAVLPFMGQLMDAMRVGVLDAQAMAAIAQAMIGPLVLFALLYMMISALFWHAPALIGWHGLPLSRALFFSMVACWRNKWPFLLYGLSWGGLFFAVQILTGLLLDAGMSPATVQLLLTPVNIWVLTILYCSFYPTYVSVFGSGRANAAE